MHAQAVRLPLRSRAGADNRRGAAEHAGITRSTSISAAREQQQDSATMMTKKITTTADA